MGLYRELGVWEEMDYIGSWGVGGMGLYRELGYGGDGII